MHLKNQTYMFNDTAWCNCFYKNRSESIPVGAPLTTPKSKMSGYGSHPISSRRSRQAKARASKLRKMYGLDRVSLIILCFSNTWSEVWYCNSIYHIVSLVMRNISVTIINKRPCNKEDLIAFLLEFNWNEFGKNVEMCFLQCYRLYIMFYILFIDGQKLISWLLLFHTFFFIFIYMTCIY